ncbi:MAG: TlpA disulfide reductase family protein [Campylobacterota bacterium]|nr:TlpA disulfide reductase family protein [Campylobacterota bacterium]
MLKKSILPILFSLTLLFQGCNDNKKVVQEANSMVSANEYILTSLDNKQFTVKKGDNGFSINELNGKIIIFDIFATWCPPCRAAASHLSSLQKKYKDDLVIIGITIEENITNEKLEMFKKQYNANYTIVNSAQNRVLVNQIANQLELGNRFPIPIMALYKDGKYINHYVGAIQEEFIDSDIKKALGK